MTDQEAMNDAMTSLISFEKEVAEHNETISKSIGNGKDFDRLIEYSRITDKIEWVNEPKIKAEYDPDIYGVFTLTHVDQWSIGDSGDSFAGFMYVKVRGEDKWLKIPYEC